MIIIKRPVSLLVLTLFLGVSFYACSREAPEPGRYYDKKRGFSIKFPEDWEVVEGDGIETSLVEAVSPWEDDFDQFSEFVGVDVEDLTEDLSLEEYFRQTKQEQVKNFSHYEEHDKGDVVINNHDAKWILFDIGTSEGINRILGYALVKGRKGYLISCAAEASKFDSYVDMFEETAHSFRIE